MPVNKNGWHGDALRSGSGWFTSVASPCESYECGPTACDLSSSFLVTARRLRRRGASAALQQAEVNDDVTDL
jgi:hypothetical protein